MYGYLVYDTAFTIVFYRAIGSPSFLLHHGLGLACCCFGLYFNKCELLYWLAYHLGNVRLATTLPPTVCTLAPLGCVRSRPMIGKVRFDWQGPTRTARRPVDASQLMPHGSIIRAKRARYLCML